MPSRICAIHQPNFFPWLGYFDKIKKCDKFIILDHVQFPKTGGGGWSNRVAFNIQGRSQWFTAPINRPEGLWSINETTFRDTHWRVKFKKTLQANYAKAPFFKKYREFIFELIDFSDNDLVAYNLNAIESICKLLNIDLTNKIVLSSSLSSQESSNEMLIALTKEVECDVYLAGGGADSYQDIELFDKANVGFEYQNFDHPVYAQVGDQEFIKGLSVIDYIFNQGAGELS